MRLMPIVLALLLAAGCFPERPRGPNADVKRELSAHNPHLRGGLIVFEANVLEGGGKAVTPLHPVPVVIDVTSVFPERRGAAARMAPGRQAVLWKATGSGDEPTFETPVDGTSIIAIASTAGEQIQVLADEVYLDTQENRAVAIGPLAAPTGASWQGPLFLGSLAIAFFTVFLPWYRLKYGGIGLAASIVLWLAYEVTVPTQSIRVDLLILGPFLLAAIASVATAAVQADKSRTGARKKPRRGG